MKRSIAAAALLSTCLTVIATAAWAQAPRSGLNNIETVVVIYAENRSFDNLYGLSPAPTACRTSRREMATQGDRDGSVLTDLPPVWGGLTAKASPAGDRGSRPRICRTSPSPSTTRRVSTSRSSVVTRDLWHLFYQNQMQIDGGKNDKFVAYADAGGLVMGHYDGSKLPLWKIAKQYTLADNFFMGAFGGSFLNHFWLVCACTPNIRTPTRARPRLIAAVEADGVSADARRQLAEVGARWPARNSSTDGQITPDFYAVNTHAAALPAEQQRAGRRAAIRASPTRQRRTRCRRSMTKTIGDLLSAKGYPGPGMPAPGRRRSTATHGTPVPNFQLHHQPFNYFAAFAPGTDGARRASQGRRHGRRRVHQGDRCRHAAAGDVLQAAGQSQRASRLCRVMSATSTSPM